ncbi:hypothetical protein [Bacillus sp. AK031]
MERLVDFLKKWLTLKNEDCPCIPSGCEGEKCVQLKEKLADSTRFDAHSKIIFHYMNQKVPLNDALSAMESLGPGWRIATGNELMQISGLFGYIEKSSFIHCPVLTWVRIGETYTIVILNPCSEDVIEICEQQRNCKAEVIYVFEKENMEG